jgi:hypothetical protein
VILQKDIMALLVSIIPTLKAPHRTNFREVLNLSAIPL